MINKEELADAFFIADVMGLAHEIAGRDHARIHELLKHRDETDSFLYDRFNDGISPRIVATLVIMEFAIKQLSDIVPPEDQVMKSNNELMDRLPEGIREEVRGFVDKLRERVVKHE